MPSLSLQNRLIWFAHCPKAGGTSIETMMVKTWGPRVGHLSWGWQRKRRRGGWRDGSPNSPQHLIWRDALDILPRRPDASFALVRDPVARLESEHSGQRRGREGRLMGKCLAFLPFSLWLRLMLAMAARDPYALDNHLRPQTDFIPDDARVFRLEDGLQPVLDWLCLTTGRDVPGLTHELKGRRSGHPAAAACLARIAAAFEADYARFGYTPTPVPPPPPTALDRVAKGLARGLVWLDRRGQL